MPDLPALLYVWGLSLHGLWRWVVLALLAAAVWTAFQSRPHSTIARWTVFAVDIQLTLGLVIYLWISPVTRQVFAEGLSGFERLYFGVLHLAAMVGVVVLAHIGGITARRGLSRRSGVFFLTALLIVIAATPWWRPLIRLGAWEFA